MPHEDPSLETLLERNRSWARNVKQQDPGFFERLARQQAPHYLWIGCADSRVPANQIMGLSPGEIFVHRNVANIVVHSDLNCLSVIQYALEVLRVRHIIVCGHYGCGGVRAALHDRRSGLIDNWLRHVQDVRNRNRDELRELKDDHLRLTRLCELNALAQAINVAETTLLQDAWSREQPVSIHALVYGLEDGILHKLGTSLTDEESLQRRKRELGW
ncbi:carbonate dehydratase [Steroidobacter denitrificans]|uniref:Carbonic anhydrase n=1 Tax=Steroidobacter denitrificans TaxID=465721 RepID=A0A127F9K1_STEDE|nr:carbonate dehydratase [Steroidobacter denitrificans]AMN46288.1 carbonate dehydratase [Steroidobacter denitrificans]